MSFFAKIFFIILLLAIIFTASFALWGEQFNLIFSQQACTDLFHRIKPYAWLLGIALLLGDIILPIPASGVMAALGSVYGLWLGILFSITGSAAAGFTGYVLARFAGRKIPSLFADQSELDRFQRFFNRWGGSAIIVSRAMPIMPEVMTILAGLAGMSLGRFTIALFLGTVPTSFLFVFLGAYSRNEPVWGVGIAVIIPLFIWPFFLRYAMPERYPPQH